MVSINRIEKYSFVSLFTGKWGELSDDSEEEDRRTPQIGDLLEIFFSVFKCPSFQTLILVSSG